MAAMTPRAWVHLFVRLLGLYLGLVYFPSVLDGLFNVVRWMVEENPPHGNELGWRTAEYIGHTAVCLVGVYMVLDGRVVIELVTPAIGNRCPRCNFALSAGSPKCPECGFEITDPVALKREQGSSSIPSP